MASSNKTPLDYINKHRQELVPVQIRLPKDLIAQVKAKLASNELTFTELVKAACYWYLEAPKDTSARVRRRE